MNWLIERLKEYSGKNCIIYNGCLYSYADLLRQVDKYKAEILGVVAVGDTVAILGDYSFYSISLFLALVENKNVIVPITNTVVNEVEDRISESGVDKIVRIDESGALSVSVNADSENFDSPLIDRIKAEGSSGLILFSSGSTGKPKAMLHNLNTLIDSFQTRKEKSLNFLVFLMFDHIGGLNTLLNCMSMGATITIPVNRTPDYICGLIEKHKVDILPASPTFLNIIIMSESCKKFDLSSLKMITYGTESMPESLLLRIKEALPKARLLQTFGTSETGIAQVQSKSSTSTLIKIDDPNIEYKIVGGELLLRSKTQILGYLNASMERFSDDGWFSTGDLVEEAADGYIRIVGRNTDVINVGGLKVLPSEVESVVMMMDGIVDVTVYGKPNPMTGNVVAANIVLAQEEVPSVLRKRVRAFCQDRLDSYKIPVAIKVVDEMSVTNRFKKVRK